MSATYTLEVNLVNPIRIPRFNRSGYSWYGYDPYPGVWLVRLTLNNVRGVELTEIHRELRSVLAERTSIAAKVEGTQQIYTYTLAELERWAKDEFV